MSEVITYEYQEQIFETNNDVIRHIRENVDTGEGEIHTMFRLTTSDEDKNGTYTVRRAEIRIAFKEKDEK